MQLLLAVSVLTLASLVSARWGPEEYGPHREGRYGRHERRNSYGPHRSHEGYGNDGYGVDSYEQEGYGHDAGHNNKGYGEKDSYQKHEVKTTYHKKEYKGW